MAVNGDSIAAPGYLATTAALSCLLIFPVFFCKKNSPKTQKPDAKLQPIPKAKLQPTKKNSPQSQKPDAKLQPTPNAQLQPTKVQNAAQPPTAAVTTTDMDNTNDSWGDYVFLKSVDYGDADSVEDASKRVTSVTASTAEEEHFAKYDYVLIPTPKTQSMPANELVKNVEETNEDDNKWAANQAFARTDSKEPTKSYYVTPMRGDSGAQESSRAPPAVSVTPAETYIPDIGGSSEHHVVNSGRSRVAVKLKCTNNRDYRISPVFAFVNPESSSRFTVSRVADRGIAKSDRVEVLWTKAPRGVVDARKAFAEGAPCERLNVDILVN